MDSDAIIIIISIIMIVGIAYYLSFPQDIPSINSVLIPQAFIDELNSEFLKGVSFAFCLEGGIENDTFIISSMLKPESSIQLENEHLGVECNKNTIATIHNHRNGICRLSPQDYYTFGISRHVAVGIICGQDDIVFYIPNNLEEGIEVNTI